MNVYVHCKLLKVVCYMCVHVFVTFVYDFEIKKKLVYF